MTKDEDIREAIIELVRGSSYILNPMKQKAMIGWLKKQNAPASDIPKTKFKAGDWAMTDYGNVVYIESISETKYLLQCIDGHHEKMSFEYVDTCWRPWTVQDAKDGDVLATKDAVFIFKHMEKAGLSLCNSYCEVIGDSKLGLGFDFSVDSVHPATKEERDILFQKIKEAGYGWDSDKKELTGNGNSISRPLGWTTVEESKQLIEAGLPVETADMLYTSLDGHATPWVWRSKPGMHPEDTPCWSLGALIQMLPLNIQTGDSFLDKYDLEFKLYSGYMVTYCIDQSHHPMVSTEEHGTLIEACIEMIIWLLKNKMI